MGTRIGRSDPGSDWSGVRQERDSGLRFSSADLVFSDVEAAVASVRDV